MNTLWEYKKIGDVCTVERGGSPRPIDKFITEDENGINWIKIGDTTESMYITKTEQKIIPEGIKKSRYVRPGDFLLSNSMSFGRPYILQIDGCIHDGWLVLRDDSDFFDKRFLYYCLSSKTTYEKFKSMAVGGVVNNLNSEMVRNVLVPVPDRVEQCEIADLLDKLTQIISYRKNEIRLLDTLIKARFVEMFGDPVADTMKWGQKPLKDFLKSIRYGTSTPPKFTDYGYAFIRATNIKAGRIVDDDMKFINQQEADRLEKFKLSGGEIIIVRSGVNAGDTCIITDKYIGQYAGYDMIIVLNEMLNPTFLNMLINTTYMERVVKPMTRRAAQPHLNAEQTQSFPIICVPRKLQDEFAEFVQQVDKSKVVVQKALDETQTLFDSLMQEYFG